MKRSVFFSALAVAGLAAATTWALTVDVPLRFPGVDQGGNLSDALGTDDSVRANVNTKTGAFRATGNATVQNQSGKAQAFKNVPVNIPSVTVSSSSYTVTKKGRASVSAKGTANF